MSFKGLMRWFIGDDKPLGPESERGLFDHFNRPETIPFPPTSEQARLNSSAEFYENERRRNDMVPCPAYNCGDHHIGFCGLCGTAGEVTKEMAKEYYDWNDRPDYSAVITARSVPTGKAAKVYGEHKPTFRDIISEPLELEPTVGYTEVPRPMSAPIRIPYTNRPQRVTEAIKLGGMHPDVYEYLVHLETHFARTAHHGK